MATTLAVIYYDLKTAIVHGRNSHEVTNLLSRASAAVEKKCHQLTMHNKSGQIETLITSSI